MDQNQDRKAAEEELEISSLTGAAPLLRLPRRFIDIFPALSHRNYQFYFIGQTISLVGFWLQIVGIGWLVFELTHSAFWVGTVAAVGGIPFLILTPFAGVIVDRVNKQKLLIITQILDAIFALILGTLVITAKINLEFIIILSLAHGIVGALDLPARFAFIIDMVGKKDLASAISLNVGTFNAARFIGPSIAGLLIAQAGVGWAFILNSISFLPGIWAIANIRPVFTQPQEKDIHPFQSFINGLVYTFSERQIMSLTLLATLLAIFVWPYQTLMPVVAQKVFGQGATGLGSLLSAVGAGSLAGALFTSLKARTPNKNPLIIWGLVITCLSLILFSLNTNYALAHLLLFTSGLGLIIVVSTLNTLVQLASPDQLRGRVLAVYLTMFIGLMPLGNSLAGFIAQKTSAIFTVGTGAVLALLIGSYLYKLVLNSSPK